MTPNCGGCQGKGAHRSLCPQHPDYHPWRLLAYRAEFIADAIGGNDTGLANRAYALAADIKQRIREDLNMRRSEDDSPMLFAPTDPASTCSDADIDPDESDDGRDE